MNILFTYWFGNKLIGLREDKERIILIDNDIEKTKEKKI